MILSNSPVEDVQENTTKWYKKGRADFCSEPEQQLSMTNFILVPDHDGGRRK